jgi:hypothetical protein
LRLIKQNQASYHENGDIGQCEADNHSGPG